MKKIFQLLFSFGIVLSVTNCDNEWEPEELAKQHTGQLSFTNLAININDVDHNTELGQYLITIYDTNKSIAGQWHYAEMPQNISLTKGDYSIIATSREAKTVEWEIPFYSSTPIDFHIEKDETIGIDNLTCSLSSVGVSIKYDEELQSLLGDDAIVIVSAGRDDILEFTRNEIRTGYFILPEGSSTMIATFSGTVGGQTVNDTRIFTNVANGQEISIDYTASDLAMSPSITSETLDIDGINILTEDIIAKVDIKAPNGIDKFEVEIISEQLSKKELQSVGLDSEFDLANPGNLEGALSSLNFPTGNAVKGQTELTFDITNFMQLLAYFQGTHQFRLTITDANALTVTKTLTFQAL